MKSSWAWCGVVWAVSGVSASAAPVILVEKGDTLDGSLVRDVMTVAINDDGEVVAALSFQDSKQAVVQFDEDDVPTVIFRAGGSVAGGTLNGPLNAHVNDLGDVVISGGWRAGRAIVRISADGTSSLLATSGTVVDGLLVQSMSRPRIGNDGRVLAQAFLGADWSGRGMIEIAADGALSLPYVSGDTVDGETLSGNLYPDFNASGVVAFEEEWRHIFVDDELVAARDGTLPDGTDLSGSLGYVRLNDVGDVLFWGSVRSGSAFLTPEGLYQHESDPVAGRELAGLGPDHDLNDHGDRVYKVTLLNVGQAIVVDRASRDADGDTVLDEADNCPDVANPLQSDADGDLQGDACDADDDGDGTPDAADLCEGTLPGDPLDANGCTGPQLIDLRCGTAEDWTGPRSYASCVARAASEAQREGLLAPSDKARHIRDAARHR